MGLHQNFMAKLPQIAASPDLTRGEQRLAAEVAFEELHGRPVPTYAHERAVAIMLVMARG